MKLERNLAIAAVAVCATPLILWMWTFWAPAFSTEQEQWSRFGGFIGGVLSPLLAFASFLGLLLTLREQRAVDVRAKLQSDDLNYFNHAKSSLERAYGTITGNQAASAPVRDRLAWLSCARLLLSASDISKRISKDSAGLLALYEGESEHWRRKFYELFHPNGGMLTGFQATYFRSPELGYGAQIEERSIRVIYEFFQWPENKGDPIDSVSKYSVAELEAMNADMSGVREYVMSMPRFREHGDAETKR